PGTSRMAVCTSQSKRAALPFAPRFPDQRSLGERTKSNEPSLRAWTATSVVQGIVSTNRTKRMWHALPKATDPLNNRAAWTGNGTDDCARVTTDIEPASTGDSKNTTPRETASRARMRKTIRRVFPAEGVPG